MSAYFPLFLDLKDQTVLLLGNGEKALEKVERLQFCQPRILLAAPELSEELGSLLRDHQFEYLQAELTEESIKDLILQTAALDCLFDGRLNGIFVSRVGMDNIPFCSFSHFNVSY